MVVGDGSGDVWWWGGEVESVVVDSVVYDHSGSSDGAKHKTKQKHGRGY